MLDLLQEVEARRGIPVDALCESIEEALGRAYRSHTGAENVLVRLERETGQFALWVRRIVVDNVTDPTDEIALSEAGHPYALGDFYDTRVESLAPSWKLEARKAGVEVIERRILEHERDRIFQHFRAMEGKVVEVLVQRTHHGHVYALLDERNEGVLPFGEHALEERISINDRLRALVSLVRKTPKGPAVFLSRTGAFVRAILSDPNVLGAARQPGVCTLLAVSRAVGHDQLEDLKRELRGERIETVRWHDDPVELARRAFSPAAPNVIDRPDLGLLIAIDDDLSTHRNADLVSQLIGRRIVPTTAAEANETIMALEVDVMGPEEPMAEAVIDPELVAKLEAFRAQMQRAAPAD
jgi:N utilization substance protein A